MKMNDLDELNGRMSSVINRLEWDGYEELAEELDSLWVKIRRAIQADLENDKT